MFRGLKKVDEVIARSIEFLVKRLYSLTGKNNFYFARLFWVFSVFLMISAWGVWIIYEIIKDSFFGVGWLGVFLLIMLLTIYFQKRDIDILEKDAQNNSGESRALCIRAYSTKQSFERFRLLFLGLLPFWDGMIAWIIWLTPIELIAIGFLCLAGSAASLGLSMYFSTIETPPKGRAKIKEWIKYLKSLTQKVLTPSPTPIPVPIKE